MDWDDNEFEFPGWSTETNPHGKEFNKEARRRMVSGSETLLPYIYKYKKELGENILEIGPFFCPLVSFKNFPNKNICYWENDYHVLEWFKKNYKEGNNKIIYCNLNSINGSKLMKLKEETTKFFNKYSKKNHKFDSVIISQVFNYIDYKFLLVVLKDFLKKDGLVFINNVIDYGLPNFFSDNRPKTIDETLESLKQSDYEILTKDIIKTPFPQSQKHDRLIVVAKSQ